MGRKIGLTEAEQLLEQTLEEEKKTDALLTQIAEGFSAPEGEGGGEEAEEMPKEEEATPKRAPGAKKAKA
nr:DUF892 family protein [Roseomonas sp. KE2513]